MATNSSKPTESSYRLLVITFLAYSLFAGWFISTRPKGKWKSPFSWHPFLMTAGMVGSLGISAVTKKMGGYTNTKMHGVLASLGFVLSLGGFYAIYHNKNLYEKPHFTSTHGKIGLAIMISMVGPLLAGGVFLHPDFGVDNTNKLIRKIHKILSRIIIAMAWGNCIYGLYGLRQSHPLEIIFYGVPLLALAPLTLL